MPNAYIQFSRSRGTSLRLFKAVSYDPERFSAAFSNPGVGKLSREDFNDPDIPQSKKLADKNRKGSFVGGLFSTEERRAATLVCRTILTYDFDKEAAEVFRRVFEEDPPAGEVFAVAHTTRSHTEEDPRFRLLVPLAQAVAPDEYDPAARLALKHLLGEEAMAAVDPASFRPAQVMFFPTVFPGEEEAYRHRPFNLREGASLFDVHPLLERFREEHGGELFLPDELPRAGQETAIRLHTTRKPQDPTAKKNVVGEFCRYVGTVQEAIEKFIPDAYEPVVDDRYRHSASTGTAGAVVLDHGLFLYSHHATDPAGGQLCNAFDLVRLHKFGELDAKVSFADARQSKELPSWRAMVEWLGTAPETADFRRFQAEEWMGRANGDGLPLDDADEVGATWSTDEQPSESGASATSASSGGRGGALELLRRKAKERRKAAGGDGGDGFDADYWFASPPPRELVLALHGLAPWPDELADEEEHARRFADYMRAKMVDFVAGLQRAKSGDVAPRHPMNVFLARHDHPVVGRAFIRSLTSPGWVVLHPLRNGGNPFKRGALLDTAARMRLADAVACPPGNEVSPLLSCGVQVSASAYHELFASQPDPSATATLAAEWLRTLEWDGVPRVEDVFTRYLGAENSTYIREASKVFFKGLVARALRPGVKFDYMLTLLGRQGCGKSRFARALVPHDVFFADVDSGFLTPKVVLERMASRWVVELAEMAALRRRDSEEVKEFITRQEDTARPAYGREAISVPRGFVVVGTTNHREFLEDETGNRRFLVVETGPGIDVDGFEEVRDQVLAEAVVMFEEEPDAPLTLPEHLFDVHAAITERHRAAGLTEICMDGLPPILRRSRAMFEFSGGREAVAYAARHGLLGEEAERYPADVLLEKPAFRSAVYAMMLYREAQEDIPALARAAPRSATTAIARALRRMPEVLETARNRRVAGVRQQWFDLWISEFVEEPYLEFVEHTGFVLREWLPGEVAELWASGDLEGLAALEEDRDADEGADP